MAYERSGKGSRGLGCDGDESMEDAVGSWGNEKSW